MDELDGFFRNQLREAALASLEAQGFTREEASSELGRRGCKAALASLEVQGFTGEGAASSELARRGREGALVSLEEQGFTGEGAALSELARRVGEANAAIYRIAGNCTFPSCTRAIHSSLLCKQHLPRKPKPEKSDVCIDCERVLGKVVVGGLCNRCYNKPEREAARKKATAERRASRGTCPTPGCARVKWRGRDKCFKCLFPKKTK